jgi:CheY-like chemotaxis protein
MQKLLIVDDSRLIRMKLRKILSSEYDIIEAANGKEAFVKLVSEKPVCVVSDLLMPEMDGFELLERIKKHDVNIPVVILSADIQVETKNRCAELGAFTVLNKPPQQELLLETLESAISSVAS